MVAELEQLRLAAAEHKRDTAALKQLQQQVRELETQVSAFLCPSVVSVVCPA